MDCSGLNDCSEVAMDPLQTLQEGLTTMELELILQIRTVADAGVGIKAIADNSTSLPIRYDAISAVPIRYPSPAQCAPPEPRAGPTGPAPLPDRRQWKCGRRPED